MKQSKFILAALFLLSSVGFSQTVTQPDYIFSCTLALYNASQGTYAYVNNEEPNQEIDLGLGISVQLSKIDNKRLSILILHDGQSAAYTRIMDGSKSSLFAMSASEVNLSCHSSLLKN